jgi:hypothetical protein
MHLASELDSSNFLRAGCFQHASRFVLTFNSEADMIDTGTARLATGSSGGQGEYRNIGGPVGKINGGVFPLLLDGHAHRLYEKLRHRVHVRGAICNVSNLSHDVSPFCYGVIFPA